MARALETDYVVVGAGAAGMAFVDALIDHDAGARVVLVDRRPGVGGHWLDAYPFVRLHQASQLYGVASTRLGDGRVQTDGPEAGLHERATGEDVRRYYARVLEERLRASDRVEFFPAHEYDDGTIRSLTTGEEREVRVRRRVVDASYLAPDVPAVTPPPFAVDDGARVVPAGLLPTLEVNGTPERWIVVGSGKTATDTCIWLLDQGVDPDAIAWVRPRDPWMLDRAVIQPDPAVFIGMAADLMESAADAVTPEDLMLHLEDRGIMLRIDRSVTPTMAKTPTLARWELERLRTIENVVRLGHIRRAAPGRLVLDGGDVVTGRGSVVVHCASPGLKYPPLVPIWGERITLQPTRAGFPCFGAALIGFVEATRDDDAAKNALCPPSPYGNSTAGWVTMQVLGHRSATAFGADREIRAWANSTLLNPARIGPEHAGRQDVSDAVARFKQHAPAGVARMSTMVGLAA
ncbi:FAD/NAD(P)-binding protein [Isoptericola variabilis]|uniref:FAD-dependent pyridine nucleotide-disulfide oxidoreductase n=1 Tax=Isoptericola variabilis (strain 225) TaxID=743718 RepID=F6FRP2_ISOV2|nr:FAD/NAD(P)-binding protein [Isoptericola variabilis]AEG42983.1 FAD-dependent pyridine nucleotide-disulfide oxidoreductase [Isoptericola variabilis 225]TWH30045.1 Pyruvate/2-oxoglutarate dehydrogenase complex, dihydrolipoamide dehydrogenase (E3) component, and related enzymes [Isoptericola variabilis J7]